MKLIAAIAALVGASVACAASSDGTGQGGSAVSASTPQPGPPSDAGAGPSEWIGLYEAETAHRVWTIRISDDNPLRLEIVAANKDDHSESMDRANLVAFGGQPGDEAVDARDLPIATLRLGFDDCDIGLVRSDDLTVTQTGACSSAGFPGSGDLALGSTRLVRVDESKACFDKKSFTLATTPDGCADKL
jgi:hypothetical protein